MKLTAIILLVAGLLAAQNTPVFPTRAVTNGDLFVATNNFSTTLLTGITSATATSATVASATGLTIPGMVTIDTEIFAVCRIAGNTLTFGKSSCPNADGRGYDGSVAVNHLAGRPVEARVVAGLHNQLAAETIAIEQRLVGSMSLKDFGAVGNGSINDYPAIAAAITTACGTGAAMYVPAGTYNHATPVVINCNYFEMFGQSRTKSIFKYTGAATMSAVTVSNGGGTGPLQQVINTRFENLQIDANGLAQRTLDLENTHRNVYRNLNIRGCTVSCFYTRFFVGNHLDNVATSNVEQPFSTIPQNGIWLDGIATANVLTDVRVDGVSNAGIYLGNAANNTIVGGLLEGNKYGIYADTGSGDNTATGTDIECNSGENVDLLGSRFGLINILSSDGGQPTCTSETILHGTSNFVKAGHFVALTLAADGRFNNADGATVQAGSVTMSAFQDLGTNDTYQNVFNLSLGEFYPNRLNSPLAIGRQLLARDGVAPLLDLACGTAASFCSQSIENTGGGGTFAYMATQGNISEMYRFLNNGTVKWIHGSNVDDDSSFNYCFENAATQHNICLTQAGHTLVGSNSDDASGSALQVIGIAGNTSLSLQGGGNLKVGSNGASLGNTCPAIDCSHARSYIKIYVDSAIVYVPAFQ